MQDTVCAATYAVIWSQLNHSVVVERKMVDNLGLQANDPILTWYS